jgi:PKD repeat protein
MRSARLFRLVMVVLAVTAVSGTFELNVWSQSGNKPPTADFRFAPNNPDNNTPIVFDASTSKDPDGKIIKYEWDFDSNGTYDETRTAALIERLFDKSGTARVTLRVTDNKGATATVTKSVRITEAVVVVRRTMTTPLKDNRVGMGQTFRVQVQITLNKTVNGLGLDEDLPAGWTMREVNNAGATLKKSQLQWLWAQQLQSGQVLSVIYDVVIPKKIQAGSYTVTGKLTSFSPRFAIKVVGATSVQVI